MLTSSSSCSPVLNPPSSVSPTTFGSCASSNASYRPPQSPRQTSRQHPPPFAKRPSASPKPAKSASVWPLVAPVLPKTTVDAATQYSPPTKSSRAQSPHPPPEADSPPPATEAARRGKRRDSSGPGGPGLTEASTASAPEPQMTLRDDGSAQLPVAPQPPSSTLTLPSKRARPLRPAMKVLPAKYELCDVKDLVTLISNMLMELVQFNDGIPLRDGGLTRFHSR
jgi:hypothetical protein